jgi:hypothetical protein
LKNEKVEFPFFRTYPFVFSRAKEKTKGWVRKCERAVEVILNNIFCDAKPQVAPKKQNPPLFFSNLSYLI